jgi:hypothetical protein
MGDLAALPSRGGAEAVSIGRQGVPFFFLAIRSISTTGLSRKKENVR